MSEFTGLEYWEDNELLTEQRLDTQQANADYLKGSIRNRILAQSLGTSSAWWSETYAGSPALGNDRLRFKFVRTSESDLITNESPSPIFRSVANFPPQVDNYIHAFRRYRVLNMAWSPAPTQSETTLRVIAQLQPNTGESWIDLSPDLAQFPLCRTTARMDYFSAWLEADPFIHYKTMQELQANAVTIIYRNLVVIGGEASENFPEDS